MVITKKIIIREYSNNKELYLCIASLNKYLKDNKEPSNDRERTYNASNNTREIYIRERSKSIYIRYKKYDHPKKRARSDKQLTDR